MFCIIKKHIKFAEYLGRKPAKLQSAINSIFMAFVKCQAMVSLLEGLSAQRIKHLYI